MAELSVAHRAALAQLVERVPDGTLSQLARAVAMMPGDKARGLEILLETESLDRTRRAQALGPLAPMFRVRADGVASTHFPPGVLPRLWKIASASEPELLPLMDDDGGRQAARAAMVCGRICLAAATAVRDQADIVWPVDLGDAAERETGLAELARCCDLGPLIHRALPSLKTWVGRPGADDLAELRLLVRDCSTVTPDGAQRVFEILFAHLADAGLILRLLAHASNSTGRETFLAGSELAVFVDRLIVALQDRVARIGRFDARHGSPPSVETLKADLEWASEILSELDTTLHLQADSPWGAAARQVRVRIGETLASLLGGVTKTVERVLPMSRVQTAGRMSRAMPDLSAPLDATVIEAATQSLARVRAVRGCAGMFGCESQRSRLVETLTERLADYADQALELVNGGDAPDQANALLHIEAVACLMDMIEATDQARTVRRRAAVAGDAHLYGLVSPVAA